jgi:hypothetical protein
LFARFSRTSRILTRRDVVGGESLDVRVVRLAVAAGEAVDGLYDLGRVAGRDQVLYLEFGVLDRVVQDRSHLLQRV